MLKVRKAIIPAAGLGTRFLPATKAQPKEMLPIVDKPAIQYIVEEAIQSGIEDILIVTGRNKRSIEDHFDRSLELELLLQEKKQLEMLQAVRDISKVNIHYIRQKEPLGLGHAVLCARRFIGPEPFAVLLGDDIITHEVPCLKQMLEVFEYTNTSVIAVQRMPEEELHKYGVIDPTGTLGFRHVMMVKDMLEKPKSNPPSSYAIIGRYVLEPAIFDILKSVPPSSGGEIQLTDALRILASEKLVVAYPFHGQRYDVGDKLGFLQATVEHALQRPDLGAAFMDYLRMVVKQGDEYIE